MSITKQLFAVVVASLAFSTVVLADATTNANTNAATTATPTTTPASTSATSATADTSSASKADGQKHVKSTASTTAS